MQLVNFKKALFLENDHQYGTGDYMERLKHNLEKEGVECRFVGRAFQKLEDVQKNLQDCEAILFASTFMYPEQIAPVAKLLKSCPSKIIIAADYSSRNLDYAFKQVFKEEELINFDHHTFYEMRHPFLDEDSWIVPYDMGKYRRAAEEAARKKAIADASIPLTGRKIVICNVQPTNAQLRSLKKGEIREELKYGNNDERPGRGVWIWGLTEPVKLLNDAEYDEWEYHEPDARAIAVWIGKMTGDISKLNPEEMHDVEDWIKNKAKDCDVWGLWSSITSILDHWKIPRRGHRDRVNTVITNYLKQFKTDGQTGDRSIHTGAEETEKVHSETAC